VDDVAAVWPLARQAEALRSGDRSVPALVEAQLDRIHTLNPRYRAFSHLDGASATAARTLQRELDARHDRGSLHGITVSVKGNLPVAGLPWTEGSALYRERVAAEDAELVARARRAGGIVLGTTTLSELALYAPDNPAEPLALNPWDVARTPGGSSAGAAVAALLGMAVVSRSPSSRPRCRTCAPSDSPSTRWSSTAGSPGQASRRRWPRRCGSASRRCCRRSTTASTIAT
jgi:Asp-tRNA(Asn)/Glu-tRNA(Gln) amidotransferase A subunit family amidase